jgi:protein involved in polysaccharide export with SLBB domain
MRFLRSFLGLSKRDKQKNVDIRNKLNQESIVSWIRNYLQSLLQHVNKIENKRLPKLALQYQPRVTREVQVV